MTTCVLSETTLTRATSAVPGGIAGSEATARVEVPIPPAYARLP